MNLEFTVRVVVDLDSVAASMSPVTKSVNAAIDRALQNVVRGISGMAGVVSCHAAVNHQSETRP